MLMAKVNWAGIVLLVTLVAACGGTQESFDLDAEAMGKAESLDVYDWDIVFIPPDDDQPAYIYPQGTVWKASFEVITTDKYLNDDDEWIPYAVIKGPHLVIDPNSWKDRIEIEMDDPWGQDFVFFPEYQRFSSGGELSGTVWFGMILKTEERMAYETYGMTIDPVENKISLLNQGLDYDKKFSEVIADDWNIDDTFRYFISPLVMDAGLGKPLKGKYDVTIRITCDGGPCTHNAELDQESMGHDYNHMPTFCGQAFPDRYKGAETICREIRETRKGY